MDSPRDEIGIMLGYAYTMLGKPYIWGGNNPVEGMDCSGFVQEVLASVGLDPLGDQTAQRLYDIFVESGKVCEPKRGCLLFFGRSKKHISHVAIAMDDLHMVEAGGGNSRCNTPVESARHGAFIKIRPISRRHDLIAAIDPF